MSASNVITNLAIEVTKLSTYMYFYNILFCNLITGGVDLGCGKDIRTINLNILGTFGARLISVNMHMY